MRLNREGPDSEQGAGSLQLWKKTCGQNGKPIKMVTHKKCLSWPPWPVSSHCIKTGVATQQHFREWQLSSGYQGCGEFTCPIWPEQSKTLALMYAQAQVIHSHLSPVPAASHPDANFPPLSAGIACGTEQECTAGSMPAGEVYSVH